MLITLVTSFLFVLNPSHALTQTADALEKVTPHDVRKRIKELSSLVETYVSLLVQETQLIEETIQFMKRCFSKETITKARQLIKKIEDFEKRIHEVSTEMELYEIDSPLCMKHWAIQLKNYGYTKEAEALLELSNKMKMILKERELYQKKPLYEMLARSETIEKFNRNFDALHKYQKKNPVK